MISKFLLSSEVSLLNLLKTIKRYSYLRTEEFKIKSKLYKDLKEIDLLLNKTRSLFPFVKIPKNMKRQNLQKIESNTIKSKADDDLESQLEEIQRKLKDLER